jgi:hypothetical protein
MPSNVWNFLHDPQSYREMRNALSDAANRGMVAGSLGAPVDMATTLTNLLIAGGGYAGHKAGLLSQPPELIDSRNVPGSSEWIGQKMQNAGIVSPNRNALAEFGMGLLSPVAYKGAQKMGGLLYNAESNALANAAKPSPFNASTRRQGGGVQIDSGAYKGRDFYHGTSGDHMELSDSYQGSVSSGAKQGHWFSYSPNYASEYAQNAAGLRGGDPRIASAKLMPKNPLVVEFNNSGKPTVNGNIMDFEDNADVIRYAKAHGHDAVDFPGGSFTDEPSVVVLRANLAKLLD